MALNLEKQLRFYGAYHHNQVNIGIHIACVPVILWTAITLATNTPPLYTVPKSLSIPYLPPNVGLFICLAYCGLYILLEPVAGSALSVLLLASTAYGNYLTSNHSPTVNYWLAGANVVSWLAQFVGHGAFEGRAPALLDNLFQAFFLAPLFVWLEILFSLGYRPELKSRLDKLVAEDIAKFRASKQQKGQDTTNGSAVKNHAKAS